TAAQAGAVPVNINPAYRPWELAYVLHQADVSVLLLHDRFKATDFFDVLAAVCPELAAAEPGALAAAACPRLDSVVRLHAASLPGGSRGRRWSRGRCCTGAWRGSPGRTGRTPTPRPAPTTAPSARSRRSTTSSRTRLTPSSSCRTPRAPAWACRCPSTPASA